MNSKGTGLEQFVHTNRTLLPTRWISVPLIHFRYGPNTCLHCAHKRTAQSSFAPSQKSRWNHRFYVWAEALSGMVFVPAQKLHGIVLISIYTIRQVLVETDCLQKLRPHYLSIIRFFRGNLQVAHFKLSSIALTNSSSYSPKDGFSRVSAIFNSALTRQMTSTKYARVINGSSESDTLDHLGRGGWIPRLLIRFSHFIYGRENLMSPVPHYDGLKGWTTCPTYTIAGMYELYEQLLPTKLYTKEKTQTSTDGEVLCRLCGKVAESIAHVLAGYSSLAQTKYLYRRNAALKILLFELLREHGLIEEVPP